MSDLQIDVVEFQSNASKEGAIYRAACCKALKDYGFEIVHAKGMRVDDCGVDVDIVALNRKGLQFLIECKGGIERKDKPGGMKSSDNVRKAIASAYCLSRSETHTGAPYTPLMVMTPYMTKMTSVNFAQLSVVGTQLMFDIVSDRDSSRLKLWAKADYSYLQGHICTYASVAWVARDNPFWCIQYPCR